MTRRGGPPDALTTKMSAPVSPSARKSKAMLFPSGDQRGLPTDPVLPRDVSRRGLPPSLSAIQISKPPLRAEVKATCSSSGENCPFPSKRVDEDRVARCPSRSSAACRRGDSPHGTRPHPGRSRCPPAVAPDRPQGRLSTDPGGPRSSTAWTVLVGRPSSRRPAGVLEFKLNDGRKFGKFFYPVF